MSAIYTSADQLIGRTPLLELTRLEKEYGLKARILSKLEYFNPAGSVKDRIARADELAAETPDSFVPGQFVNPGPHKIQGIGPGFVPEVLNTKVYDEIIPVTNDDAFAVGRDIGRHEGVLVGISSGAAAWAAVELASAPKTRARLLWSCCRTPATGTFPHRCSRNNTRFRPPQLENPGGV